MDNPLPSFSMIALVLSLLFFILPVIFGNSVVIAFFVISFVFLITAFVLSVISLKNTNDKEEKRYNLALIALIVSIVFLAFLLISALIV